jgi:hypothetical protein
MTIDEAIRATSYSLMIPAFTFFALMHWNRQKRVVAIAYAALAVFFVLILFSLIVGGYDTFRLRYLEYLYINTVVVVVMAAAVAFRATRIVWRALTHYASVKILEDLYD